MAWPRSSYNFDEVIKIQLTKKGAIVVVLEILGEKVSSEILWFMNSEDGAAGQPAYELWLLLFLEDETEFLYERGDSG